MTHKDSAKPQEERLTDSIILNSNTQDKGTVKHLTFYYLLGLISLISALIFVVFYLPKAIDKPELETSSSVFIEKELSKPIDESPWHEIQLSKHRKTSQEILSNVLDKQNTLEKHQVKLWASKPFKQALEKAKQGDLFYRNQEFEQAISLYLESLSSLESLELEIPKQYEAYLKQGSKALENNNASDAKRLLQIAMYLQPNKVISQQKYDRALVLDEVLSLNKEGLVHMKNNSLDLAKARFLSAYSLDKDAVLTKNNLASVNAKITQRDYSKAMSQGYVSLNNNEFDNAISFFNQAQKISPTVPAPKVAIRQSKNQKTQHKISQIMRNASLLEKELQWHSAAKQYKQALNIDSSLTTARIGLIRSRSKAGLEDKLNFIMKHPMRLSNHNVYSEAQRTYKEAISIRHRDNKLKEQIASVKRILAQSQSPISIEISSDNLTSVTIYRVGDIGLFINKHMSLKPGEYTLIGSRSGYRDIRKVVRLIPGSKNNKVHVTCIEKVNNG